MSKTHEHIIELAKIDPDFYSHITTTELLFYGNNVVREINFFFENTSEKELVIRMEEIEQGDPNRRIFWDSVRPEDREKILNHVVQLLNKKGFPTEVLSGTEMKIQRGQSRFVVPHTAAQLENNKDVPLVKRLLMLNRR